MYLKTPATEKVRVVDAREEAVNEAIEQEAQTGWNVKQIIYLQQCDEVMILFERDDVETRISISNIECDLPF